MPIYTGPIDNLLGSRDINWKPGPTAPDSIKNRDFYTMYDEETGETQIKERNLLDPLGATDTYIGKWDKNKKFIPVKDLLTQKPVNAPQQQYFASPEGTKVGLKKAQLAAKKDLMDNGSKATGFQPVSEAEATKLTEHISNSNTGTPPTTDPNTSTTGTPTTGTASRTEFPGAKGKEPLIYPLSIGSTQQDVLQFQMLEYVARGLTPGVGSGAGTRPSTSKRDIIGSVMLPIPGGIQSTNAVKWDEDSANPFELMAAGFSDEAIQGKPQAAIENIVKQAQGNTGALKDLVPKYFAAAAIGKDGNTFLGRGLGAIMNPNMELLFSAPTLRPFNFRFRLSPRSKDESKAVIQIIRFFQQGMAPRTDGDLLFLKSPHTFQLKYLYRGEGEHPFLNSFKECALENFIVNYTPENNYSTYEDGVMNSYEMDMQFQELQPVLNSDYDSGEGEFPADLNFREQKASTPAPTPARPVGGQGGNKSRYSSGVKKP